MDSSWRCGSENRSELRCREWGQGRGVVRQTPSARRRRWRVGCRTRWMRVCAALVLLCWAGFEQNVGLQPSVALRPPAPTAAAPLRDVFPVHAPGSRRGRMDAAGVARVEQEEHQTRTRSATHSNSSSEDSSASRKESQAGRETKQTSTGPRAATAQPAGGHLCPMPADRIRSLTASAWGLATDEAALSEC